MFLIFNFWRYGSSSSFPLIHYVPKIQVAVLDWKPNGLEKEGLWTLEVQFMTNVWKYVPCESKRELKFFPSPPSLTRALHTETSRASSVQFDEDHQCTMSRQTFSSRRPVCSVLCGSGGGRAVAARRRHPCWIGRAKIQQGRFGLRNWTFVLKRLRIVMSEERQF